MRLPAKMRFDSGGSIFLVYNVYYSKPPTTMPILLVSSGSIPLS